jgi:Tfp pilus assembly protein PilX
MPEADHMTTRKQLRDDDGWVLVTSVICLAVMVTVTLASFSLVDTGQKRSREQRERETSLNVAEGALYSQGFTLAQRWPGNVGAVVNVPESCTQASTDPLCPTPGQITATNSANAASATFTNVDARDGATWMTKVRDNGGSIDNAFESNLADQAQSGTNVVTGQSYTCAAPCRWDANGDKQLWVQARATVRDRQRDLVALLKLETVLEATPETAIIAGGIKVGNQGNKIMLYGEGSQIVVRCDAKRNNCVISQPGQIVPAPVTANTPPFMTSTQLARFKQRAITDGNYYAGCPSGNLAGAVVWVEACSDGQLANAVATQACNPAPPPSPGGGGTPLSPNCVNQYSRPGILIWHCGKMDFSGSWTYRGILYGVNNSDGTCPAEFPAVGLDGNCTGNNNNHDMVITMTGGFGVWGVMVIDGGGCLYTGSDAIQLHYDPNVFGAVSSYGTVGLVQNTWRELPPS